MLFPRIEAAFRICSQFLNGLPANDIDTIEISHHIVSSLIVLITSEFEEEIERLFINRAMQCSDRHMCNFVKSKIPQEFRSPDISNINKVLKLFGNDYFDSFQIVVNSQARHAWDNILRARHAVVHKQGVLQLTFQDVKMSYHQTQTIFDELLRILNTNHP